MLHASAHGKFRTSGRYSAATVRGTIWTVADRCDGTLTHDVTDSVAVKDFVHHKTIILHAGQSYLARSRKGASSRRRLGRIVDFEQPGTILAPRPESRCPAVDVGRLEGQTEGTGWLTQNPRSGTR